MIDFAYILSASYSGSTLLTFLLATHSKVATIGELKATSMGDIEQYACSCGRLIRACPFWRQVTEGLGRRGVSFDVGDFRTHFRARNSHGFADRVLAARVRGPLFELGRAIALRAVPAAASVMQQAVARNRALIEVIREMQGAEVFLDGSKDPTRLRHLLSADFLNVKVLYLIRDGRGATNSYMRHNQTPMAVAAREWRNTHAACERVLKRLPAESKLQIHYEDLCAEPDHTLARIFRFLGLDPVLARRDFRSCEHHILGNAMRLRDSSGIRLDERWKTALSPDDLATFDRLAGDWHRRYGYD